MRTSLFILVVAAIGVVYMAYFKRLKDRAASRRRKGEENPVRYWLKGQDDQDGEDR
jgi:hypothetical protein